MGGGFLCNMDYNRNSEFIREAYTSYPSLYYISKNLARHFTKFQPWMVFFVNVAQFQRPVFVKRYPERRALGAFFQLTDWIGIS